MSKKKTGEIAAQVKKDRLNKHLDKVEKLIERWIPELLSPSPFYWHGSTESEDYLCEAPMIWLGEFWELRPWQMWVCCDVYKPPLEEEEDSNHMLRKHLGSRRLWKYHTEWEARLNGIGELARSISERAAELQKQRGLEGELAEGYTGIGLCKRFDLVSARSIGMDLQHGRLIIHLIDGLNSTLERDSYRDRNFFRPSNSGIWYYPAGRYGSGARPEEPARVIEEHWDMIHELQFCPEMRELAKGWQRVLELQEKMQAIARTALKSSDIFHPCQFCRKLW